MHRPLERRLLGSLAVLALLAVLTAGPASASSAPAHRSASGFAALTVSHRHPAGKGWMSPDATKGPVAYVADFGDNTIDVFSQTSYALVGQITSSIFAPYGMTTDAHGTLYAASQGFQNVAIIAKNATRPKLLLFDTGIPFGVAVGKDGTVYVAEDGFIPGIDVFAKGQVNPSYTIGDSSFSNVYGVALDAMGNIYVSGSRAIGGGKVSVFPPGSHGPGTDLGLTGLGTPLSMLFDKAGDLLVGDEAVSVIDVYPPGQTVPAKQLFTNNAAYIAFNRTKTTIWAPTYGLNGVSVRSYPSNALAGSFAVSGAQVELTGVALSPQ